MISETFLDVPTEKIRELNRYISTIIGAELNDISRPCYYPKTIKYKNDLFARLNVKPADIKSFVKQFDADIARFNMFNDDFTIVLLMATIYFAKTKRTELSRLSYLLLAIKFYSSLVHIAFPKFCNEDLWSITLTRVSPKHLFRDRNGVSNAVVYVSDALYRIYANILMKDEISSHEITRITFDLRHRLSQSVKSFAEAYYALQKSGIKGYPSEGDIGTESTDLHLVADKISMSMCTFEQIDDKAIEFALTKSGMRRDIAYSLISEISSVEYKDRIRFIVVLMGKLYLLKNLCKDSGRNILIRKIENEAAVGNYIVKNEIIKLLYETELGFRLKTFNKSQLVIFFSHYLTLFIQKRLC